MRYLALLNQTRSLEVIFFSQRPLKSRRKAQRVLGLVQSKADIISDVFHKQYFSKQKKKPSL